MDTEQLATAEIVRRVSYSANLTAQIETNDKTYFTDGHIEVFSKGEKSKRTYIGRVAVQVKGRSGKPSKKFSVPTADLRGFLAQKGVLYFVVFIDTRTKACIPYYAALSPFKIRAILDEMQGQAKARIRLEALPSESSNVEAIARFCVQAQKEDPDLGLDPSLIPNIESISLYTPEPIDLSVPMSLIRTEMNYSVVINSSSGQHLPVDGDFTITPLDYMYRAADYAISAGGVTFSGVLVKKVDASTIRMKISDGITIKLCVNGPERFGTIAVQPQNSLNARHSDLIFVAAVFDTGGFYVDGNFTKLASQIDGDHDDLRMHLTLLNDLTEMFEALHVDTSLIDLSEIAESQYRQLVGLGRALKSGNNLQASAEPTRLRQQVGRRWLDLLRFSVPGSGDFSYSSTFDRRFKYRFVLTSSTDKGETEANLATPYDFIDTAQFADTLNSNLESVVEAYDALSEYPNTMKYANNCVLKLLLASDLAPERRPEFLRAANELNTWIISRDGEQPHHLVNQWQIAARQRRLTDAEFGMIRSLKHADLSEWETEFREQIKISCAILLNEDGEVEYLITKLSPDSQRRLFEWPIWHLFTSTRPGPAA